MRVLPWTALVALLPAGSATAQPAGSRSGSSTDDSLSNMNACRELRMFGICLVRTERPAALAIIRYILAEDLLRLASAAQ